MDSLTSLRFFAAAMVVVSHAATFFHFLDKPAIINLPLAQGVSFFFVLSGFILTYNYPRLKSDGVLQFWRARFARVWPAHAFALFLCLFVFALKPLTSWGVPLIANIAAHAAMVHGWLLQDQFFFTINPPSWSISTEFAFYLLFPLLIWKQESNWWQKLILSACIVVGFIGVGAHWHLPELSNPNGLSIRGLIYINPLVRLFEFVLGMSAATLWMKVKDKRWSASFLTVLEVASITWIIMYVANISHWVEPLAARSVGRLIKCWLLYDGNCFAFAGLIFAFALQRGFVARALSNKVSVWLGEISYSIYLLHMMLLLIYSQNKHLFSGINSAVAFMGYCVILVACSHLTYKYVEKPARNFLAGRKRSSVLTTGDLLREVGEPPASPKAAQPEKLFGHIPFLDGLRALAIFWVLNFHSGGQIGEIFSKRGGWAGVDAFFVISGFLITGILLREKSVTENISLKNFYARRALRLMPAYVLFIAVTCWVNPLHCNNLLPAVGIAAIYMCDFDLALAWGHILHSGLEISWSLSVEEKFYLLWPTLMKTCRKHLVWIAVALIIACFAWRAYLLSTGAFWMRLSAGFDTKIDALLFGCLGAIALHNNQTRQWLQKNCTHVLLPIVLLLFSIYYVRGMGHPFGAISLQDKLLYWDVRLPLFTLSFTALILSLCLQPTSIVARFFSLPPFVWVGKVSYSLYLWHMLAFAWVMANAFQPGKSDRLDVELLEYSLALAFAAISFYLVEKPFLKIKDRFSLMTKSGAGSRPGSGPDASAGSSANSNSIIASSAQPKAPALR